MQYSAVLRKITWSVSGDGSLRLPASPLRLRPRTSLSCPGAGGDGPTVKQSTHQHYTPRIPTNIKLHPLIYHQHHSTIITTNINLESLICHLHRIIIIPTNIHLRPLIYHQQHTTIIPTTTPYNHHPSTTTVKPFHYNQQHTTPNLLSYFGERE